jgi:2'-5' RNA ligase
VPIAVTLDLDAAAAANVEPLWDVLEQAPELTLTTTRRVGVHAHITLAVYDAVDLRALLPRLDGFARGLQPVAIRFASIGVFAGDPRATIFLGPSADRVLLELHDAFHREFADCLDRCIAHYRPAYWVPHLTLAQEVENAALPLAVARIAGVMAPFTGMLDVLSIVRYMPVERIDHYALGAARG